MGVWSNTEAMEQHTAAFTLNIAHGFRLASAYRDSREESNKTISRSFPPQKLDSVDRTAFIEDLNKATCFSQGLKTIAAADKNPRMEYKLRRSMEEYSVQTASSRRTTSPTRLWRPS